MELAPQSENTKKLEEYIGAVRNKNESLRNNEEFKTLLKEAGKDPLMTQAQDEVFDKLYWKPAMQAAEKAGVTSPLGCALLTDTDPKIRTLFSTGLRQSWKERSIPNRNSFKHLLMNVRILF
jgi:hypothetical protein